LPLGFDARRAGAFFAGFAFDLARLAAGFFGLFFFVAMVPSCPKG
jgi:hypothetical protein